MCNRRLRHNPDHVLREALIRLARTRGLCKRFIPVPPFRQVRSKVSIASFTNVKESSCSFEARLERLFRGFLKALNATKERPLKHGDFIKLFSQQQR